MSERVSQRHKVLSTSQSIGVIRDSSLRKAKESNHLCHSREKRGTQIIIHLASGVLWAVATLWVRALFLRSGLSLLTKAHLSRVLILLNRILKLLIKEALQNHGWQWKLTQRKYKNHNLHQARWDTWVTEIQRILNQKKLTQMLIFLRNA